MKKEYAVNIKSVNSDSDWNTADMQIGSNLTAKRMIQQKKHLRIWMSLRPL